MFSSLSFINMSIIYQIYKIKSIILAKKRNEQVCTHSFLKAKTVITMMTYYYQLLESASDGILKSPLGETLTVPTLGPSGIQFLLN